jgi:subtilisin family serine protease
MRLVFIICSLLLSITLKSQVSEDHIPGRLIIKVKSEFSDKCNKSSIAIPSLNKTFSAEEVQQVNKIFPFHKKVKRDKANANWVDLSTIYRLQLAPSGSLARVIKQLKKNPAIAYVEPEYINQLTYTPSDTSNNRQWYLNAIKAFDAWDVNKGDTSVVIAIIDTGSDMDHEDLIDDYAYNFNDPINGVDDDNDGYTDNYYGWDVANNDNNPEHNGQAHGTNCAGIASASTDNVTGISGCGFNSRILPVRIDDDATGGLTAAYEGIVYAADHGAFIISNSWGSYRYSKFAQDVVNYAAINKGAVVIGAMGNDGKEDRFYPAAYENVFAVGSSLPGDTVKENSNYGYWGDIYAPGELLYTTSINGQYQTNGGTSMAGPVVAGVAALIKSNFPNYSAQQVIQQLTNCGDDIYSINDSKYANKLGAGRVNAFKAVTDITTPGITFEDRNVSDRKNDAFTSGDTIYIHGTFMNYLADANNVTASLNSIANKLTLINGSVNLGNITKLNSANNISNPFIFVVPNNLSTNELIEMELSILADNYSKKEFFTLIVNPDYLTVQENNLTVTLSSNGNIGYAGNSGELGEGIRYLNNRTYLYEGGFAIGNSPSYIPNQFRSDSGTDSDFSVINPVSKDVPASKADYEASCVFSDENLSPGGKIQVSQKNYFFTDNTRNNSVIYTFNIKNIGGSDLNALYAGMFLDWDIIAYENNKVFYDPGRNMGISYSTDQSIYCGVKALNENVGSLHYAIDNITGGNGGINAIDGFSDNEKYIALSTSRDSAGNSSPSGNDILDVNSIGPFDLKADSTFVVSFAITISTDLYDLYEEADSIQQAFKKLQLGLFVPGIISEPSRNFKLYPNPAQNQVTINFSIPASDRLQLKVFDLNGKLVYQQENKNYPPGNYILDIPTDSWKTGAYFFELRGDNYHFRNKFVVSP